MNLSLSLRFKVTLAVSLLLAIVIFTIAYSVAVTQKNFLIRQISDTRERTLRSFSSMCNEAVKYGKEEQVESAVNLLISTYKPSVVYSGYINADGGIIYSSRYNDVNIDSEFKRRIKNFSKERSESYVSYGGEQIYEMGTPFFINGGQYAGTFIIGFSQTAMNKHVATIVEDMIMEIRKVSLIVMTSFIVLAFFLGYFMFVKPLNLLIKASEQITEGNFNVEISVKRHDEIGKLAQTFNNMVKRIENLDSMKDSFVSSVSHELRSPLSAIDGYCDLLIGCVESNYENSKEQLEKGLQIMKQATVRLTNFINNILDLAKMKANKLEIKIAPAEIEPIIQEIVALYQPMVLQQEKTIGYEISGEIPELEIDSERIKQVITNLVSNAVKFTKKGGSIKIKVLPSSPGYGTDYIEVWVQDDGTGIPKQQVDLIFEKFYQVQESEFKRPKGTGLGLTIVFEMIKIHKGYIWAESDLGKGTTFKFALPKKSYNDSEK
ncbi:MAG: sensor histidine kinase [Elusimicrobia bacterium]|nr:sensor histidine kinase [Elusimicrobiota bacterium]